MTKFVGITCSVFAVLITLSGQAGQYLGEEPPGKTPEVFAADILSRSKPEWAFGSAFAPGGHEFCFSSFDTTEKIDRIQCTKLLGDVWTTPSVAPFSGTYSDNDVRIAPDGSGGGLLHLVCR